MITRIEKFGATWCGPCKVLEKTMEDVLSKYPDIQFTAYDADEDEDKFEEMHVLNVPQLYFYNEAGTEVGHLVGAHPATKIIEIIESNKS